MRRRCLSGGSYLPPHRAWPIIRSRTKAGGLLFPGYNKNNINRSLKFTIAKTKFPDAHRYASKAFLRGDTQEILQPGVTIEVTKSSWTWLGGGFRSYVDFEFTRPRKISRLLIALDDSSPEEEPRPRNKAARTLRSTELHSANTDPTESDSPHHKIHQ